MRPIAELPVEVARSLHGVVFDVDDTLTRGGILEEEAYAALFRLREAGLLRIAVTGRPLGWAEVIAHTWPIDLAVGENGAGYARRDGAVVRRGFFDGGEAERARQRVVLERVAREVAAALPEVTLASDSALRSCDLAFDVGETVTLAPERVAILRRVIEAAGARAVVSTVHAHAIPGAWDKASGTERAVRALGLGPEELRAELLFVGDSGNDAPAFAYFAHTAAVANVAPHLSALPVPPAFVAQADRGRGFAEIVAALLERRRA